MFSCINKLEYEYEYMKGTGVHNDPLLTAPNDGGTFYEFSGTSIALRKACAVPWICPCTVELQLSL